MSKYNFIVEYAPIPESISAGKEIYMASVFNEKKEYIGALKCFIWLLDKGIIPETIPLRKGNERVCSIGKSVIDGKWYGWSHRAHYGFKIGDKVEKGSCCAKSGWTDEYLKEHPEEDLSLPIGFIAYTEEDAKKMAIAFADSVA